MTIHDRLRAIGVSPERLKALGIATAKPSPAELSERARVVLAQAEQAKQREEQRVAHLAEYQRLRASNPFAAARYAASHPEMFTHPNDDPPTAA